MGQLREILKQLILLLSLFGSQGTSYFGWQCLEGRLCFDSQAHTRAGQAPHSLRLNRLLQPMEPDLPITPSSSTRTAPNNLGI